MGSRLKLYFDVFESEGLSKKISDYKVVRLRTVVFFKTQNNWSKMYDAIVDTGAHISVIPLSIWKKLKVVHLAKHQMQGLVTKPECTVPVEIGKVEYSLADYEGNYTKSASMLAFLASTDDVPLIIGFRDVLSRYEFCCNFSSNIAYLEELE